MTHDAARQEAFIDAFASLRATATLDAHDERFDTYLAIQDELLRAETERRASGEPAPLTKASPRLRVAARMILALGADREDVERYCARLAFDYGLVHLSASALTRAHVAHETLGVAVLERWDALLRRNEWAFSTDLTLRLLREAVRAHGPETAFIVDWFPANLDQAREFETRASRRWTLRSSSTSSPCPRRASQAGRMTPRMRSARHMRRLPRSTPSC